MKTERFAASFEHKRRYLFVPLANQASQAPPKDEHKQGKTKTKLPSIKRL
jgi:hypothetical protein